MTIEQHEPASQAQGPTPGSMLRAAREARGMSEQEVADSLKLRLSLVRDIEQDRFDQQTAHTFTKGYLRIYARLVGVAEDTVVAAYEGMGYVETPFAEMHSFSERTRREARERRIRLASWSIVILLIAGVLYWIIARPAEKPAVVHLDDKALSAPASQDKTTSTDNKSTNSAPVTTAATADSAATAAPAPSAATAVAANTQAANTPVANTSTAANTPVAAPMSPAAAALVAAGADPAKVVPQTAATQTAAADQTASTAEDAGSKQPAADQAKGDVVITFKGDCWLEVYDAKNKKLLSGTRRAGQHEALSGEAPFRMIVGAPKNVIVTFKGENVDMKRFPVGRVARFQLPLQK